MVNSTFCLSKFNLTPTFSVTCIATTLYVTWPSRKCKHNWLRYSQTRLLVMKNGFIWYRTKARSIRTKARSIRKSFFLTSEYQLSNSGSRRHYWETARAYWLCQNRLYYSINLEYQEKQPMLSTHRLLTFVPYWEHLSRCGTSLIPDMHQMNCLPSWLAQLMVSEKTNFGNIYPCV